MDYRTASKCDTCGQLSVSSAADLGLYMDDRNQLHYKVLGKAKLGCRKHRVVSHLYVQVPQNEDPIRFLQGLDPAEKTGFRQFVSVEEVDYDKLSKALAREVELSSPTLAF